MYENTCLCVEVVLLFTIKLGDYCERIVPYVLFKVLLIVRHPVVGI